MVSSKAMKISTKLVSIGMYVSELDRPWETTPFSIHGFYVRDLDEVKQLKIHCEYVYIDPDKGITPEQQAEKQVDENLTAFKGKLVPVQANTCTYSEVTPLAKEMGQAKEAYETLVEELIALIAHATSGILNNLESFIQASDALVESFVRNPDAIIWLVRVRKTQADNYYYLLRSACWAILLGRHLGLAKVDLRALSLGVLLKNIGCFRLPKVMQANYVNKQQSSKADPDIQAIVIENTVNLLQASKIHPKVLKVIKMQGERLNGSGLPRGLQGDDIFLLAKIAGLACFYDQVTYKPGAKCATPVSQSVSNLYRVRGIYFQDDLVTAFIKAIGLYPTGTLVKLNTKAVAVVVEQNYERRLKPKILVVVDANGQALDKLLLVDLYENDQQAVSAKKSVEKLDITEDIEPYKYPIKVTKIREEFVAMNTRTKKSFFSFFK